MQHWYPVSLTDWHLDGPLQLLAAADHVHPVQRHVGPELVVDLQLGAENVVLHPVAADRCASDSTALMAWSWAFSTSYASARAWHLS